jgi:uncharacterized protein (DUF58 family)
MRFDAARFDPEVLQQMGRIDLIARAIVDGLREGMHSSRRRGFSTEFSDFRPYVPGDDLRFLDWALYARTERLYVKCFEAETNLEAMLLLDATRSMAWRWQDNISKLEYAANLLAALACLHVQNHDQVGLLVHDADGIQFMPPRARRTQLERMLAILEGVQPSAGDVMRATAEELATAKRHRGRIVVCSDLMEEQEHVKQALPLLTANEDEVFLFHILDRAEIELPFEGATHLRDSETGAVIPIDVKAVRDDHQRRVGDFRALWEDACKSTGILYIPADTGMNYVDVLSLMIEKRG